jgi:hypothetical protein
MLKVCCCVENSYLCSQLGNALFCVTSQRVEYLRDERSEIPQDHTSYTKLHFLTCYIRVTFFLILTKKKSFFER